MLVLALESDGKISIVHRLRGHAGEIHSLSWCPVPDRHIDFGTLEVCSTGRLSLPSSEII